MTKIYDQSTNKFLLPNLSYGFSDLEPYIDSKTMEIHYTKHHQAYVDKLNKALEQLPEIKESPLEEILNNLSSIPESARQAVKNNGGGHWNHSFFWEIIGKSNIKKEPEGDLNKMIESNFGNFEEFKKKFSDSALNHFGSGWAWLLLKSGNLEIITTANQDVPFEFGSPLLTIDLWEHAYYLKYQNRRIEYIENWWNVVNWSVVSLKLAEALELKNT